MNVASPILYSSPQARSAPSGYAGGDRNAAEPADAAGAGGQFFAMLAEKDAAAKAGTVAGSWGAAAISGVDLAALFATAGGQSIAAGNFPLHEGLNQWMGRAGEARLSAHEDYRRDVVARTQRGTDSASAAQTRTDESLRQGGGGDGVKYERGEAVRDSAARASAPAATGGAEGSAASDHGAGGNTRSNTAIASSATVSAQLQGAAKVASADTAMQAMTTASAMNAASLPAAAQLSPLVTSSHQPANGAGSINAAAGALDGARSLQNLMARGVPGRADGVTSPANALERIHRGANPAASRPAWLNDFITQISVSRLRHAGVHKFLIQLQPLHLGEVAVQVEASAEGKLNVQMSANSREAIEVLARDHRELVRELRKEGAEIQPEDVSFVLDTSADSGGSPGGFARSQDDLAQHGWQQRALYGELSVPVRGVQVEVGSARLSPWQSHLPQWSGRTLDVSL